MFNNFWTRVKNRKLIIDSFNKYMFDSYHGCNDHNYVGEEPCGICKLSKPTMQNFKEGDKIRMLKSCMGSKKGSEYIIEYDKNGDLRAGDCYCRGFWELISVDPWDKLKVGNLVGGAGNVFRDVVEILNNSFALADGGGIFWVTFESAKKRGWTIKDSTPKEEEENMNDDEPHEPMTPEEKLEAIKRILL